MLLRILKTTPKQHLAEASEGEAAAAANFKPISAKVISFVKCGNRCQNVNYRNVLQANRKLGLNEPRARRQLEQCCQLKMFMGISVNSGGK